MRGIFRPIFFSSFFKQTSWQMVGSADATTRFQFSRGGKIKRVRDAARAPLRYS